MRSNQKFFFLKSQDELGSNVLALETHTFNLLSGNGKTFSLKKNGTSISHIPLFLLKTGKMSTLWRKRKVDTFCI